MVQGSVVPSSTRHFLGARQGVAWVRLSPVLPAGSVEPVLEPPIGGGGQARIRLASPLIYNVKAGMGSRAPPLVRTGYGFIYSVGRECLWHGHPNRPVFVSPATRRRISRRKDRTAVPHTRSGIDHSRRDQTTRLQGVGRAVAQSTLQANSVAQQANSSCSIEAALQ